MNLKRRLKALERDFIIQPIKLKMPDGRTVTLPGGGDHALNLLALACRKDRTPEMELIARSVSSTEPGEGHLIELAPAILNSSREDTQ